MGKRIPYTPVYTDLEKAIRELGTVRVLQYINAGLHKAGRQRTRNTARAARAAVRAH